MAFSIVDSGSPQRPVLKRRGIVLAAAMASAGAGGSAGCAFGNEGAVYDEAAKGQRRALGAGAGATVPLSELVRYATLAPSSHNTQCWKFRIDGLSVAIHPDLSRRCPAVDPDNHHLFVSLGCAAENLIQAGLANGLQGELVFESMPADVLRIALEPTRPIPSPWFGAIPARQCTRAAFDGKAVSSGELGSLRQAGTGRGVEVILLTGKLDTEKVLAYVLAANSQQMGDPAFVAELKHWIRFSDAEAVRTGDGLATRASGNPSLPRWMASPLFGLFVSAEGENDQYAKQVRSSAGIAVFVSEADDKPHWVEAGRCYQRFALQATALGIRTAFLNQPVEVGSVRPEFASLLGVPGRRPDLVVRFGRGPAMPSSLRRPVSSVLM